MFTYLRYIPPVAADETNRRQFSRQFQLPGASVIYMNRGIETRRTAPHSQHGTREVQKAYISSRSYSEFDIRADTKLTRVPETDMRAVHQYMSVPSAQPSVPSAQPFQGYFYQETRTKGETRI